MRIDIITCVPKIFDRFLTESIIGKAIKNQIVSIHIHDIRNYGIGKYRQIDDSPYGGGAGMILMPEPLAFSIESCTKQRKYDEVIFFLPEGNKIEQSYVNRASQFENILMVCGHYKGIDQRIVDLYATQILSIGDFIVTGGEIPAMLLSDAITRLIPGAIGNEQSALEDSFQDNLLSPPVYTRPPLFNELAVPKVLFSGDHKKISEWRMEQAYKKTSQLRPDLLDSEEG